MNVLREGTRRANVVAEETLALAKAAMKQDYFGRKLDVGDKLGRVLTIPGEKAAVPGAGRHDRP
jgi:hypothetical protein